MKEQLEAPCESVGRTSHSKYLKEAEGLIKKRDYADAVREFVKKLRRSVK